MKKFILLGIIIAASDLWCSQLQAQIFKGFNAYSVKDEVITEQSTSKSVTKSYIDLGLPSGTLWCNQNEEGLYTHDDAVIRFGDALPTTEQWKELRNSCLWTWNGNGYKIVGPNGASIILPAEGRHLCDGALERSSGYYWSASPFVKDNLILTFDNLFFTTSTVMFYYSSPCNQYSIRLIQMR